MGVSGQCFSRPVGLTRPPGATEPAFGPCKRRDYELGKNPVTLPNGKTHTFLKDGGTLVIRGWCENLGAARIGFGECARAASPERVTHRVNL